MLRPFVLAALLAGVVLAAAPVAEAKISLPLSGRALQVGQQVTVRVGGCKSAKPCRWAAGMRIVLARPYDRAHPNAWRRPIATLAEVSAYGMVRFEVPAVTAGSYTVVAIFPHGAWRRGIASGPFTIQP
jgi:hypothetical protein